MTSTNINPIQEAVLAFRTLHIDDKLAVLALLFTEVSEAIPVNELDAVPKQEAAGLVAQVQKLSHEEQLFALRDLLGSKKSDEDEVVLDPHPTKALGELFKGGTTIPTHEYGSMNPESKLAFWYLVAERMGTTTIAIPPDYESSEQADEVFSLLESMNADELVSFLKKVL